MKIIHISYWSILDKFSFVLRVFNLKLKKSEKSTYFNTSFEADYDHENINAYLGFYEGSLIDEPNTSHAKGIIVNGSFFGSIYSDLHGKFSIEPPGRYAKNSTVNFDAIIYHEDNLNLKRLFSKQLSDNYSQILDVLENTETKSLWTSSIADHSTMSCATANATIDLLMSHELNKTAWEYEVNS